ncbi:MAG: NADPH-dependent assimilatory sulfite reductase hemoprotein subunit [Planctomycetaceae bacterium]|nr:NADPH-dependent assimilatory sulfite reductase hemoprotein subunit [Planctomycetaceae bacterium]
MSEETKLSALEGVKEASRFLRGSIAEELASSEPSVSGDTANLLKFHGTYQQDDRDHRGGGDKDYIFMVRSRIPGGKVSAAQFLAELDLCERYGNGTLRVTDRQGFQLHGVHKGDLKAAIRGINDVKLSTQSACGDVCRNFMCCPAPIKNSPVRAEMQTLAHALADHFRPKSAAYYEIWLKDGDSSEKVHEVTDEHEPIYGKTYLPRKFKMGIALPEDNCIDVYTQDLGFLAIVEGGRIVGYNVLPGGGMGMTPAKKDTFPAVAKRLTFVPPDRVIPVAEAIVKVQRDHGNRADRKLARMKYLIANWGLERFKAMVEEYYGAKLPEPHPADVTDVDDHIGWHEQGDGRLFLGLNIENGRIKDEGDFCLKTAIRALLAKYPVETRLTALQSVLFCDLEPSAKADVEAILRDHGIPLAADLTLARRYAIACPAYPTCGLAVTESERVMPQVLDTIEAELNRQGLIGERVAIHMTGCPNGCGRPYTPDIGLVGKAKNKYTLYLGGNAQGTRLAFLYRDMVPQEEIASTLAPIFSKWKAERSSGESFGDFCDRVGKESLA